MAWLQVSWHAKILSYFEIVFKTKKAFEETSDVSIETQFSALLFEDL